MFFFPPHRILFFHHSHHRHHLHEYYHHKNEELLKIYIRGYWLRQLAVKLLKLNIITKGGVHKIKMEI